jgi:hypothetical protein
MPMRELWNIRAEITVEPHDFPSGNTNGFMNVITWADSADHAREKIETYFARFNWNLIEVQGARVVDVSLTFKDEYNDMVESARLDQTAILCGTFHGFRAN